MCVGVCACVEQGDVDMSLKVRSAGFCLVIVNIASVISKPQVGSPWTPPKAINVAGHIISPQSPISVFVCICQLRTFSLVQ